MTGSELQVFITVGLMGAMLLGWILRWIWSCFATANTTSIETIEELQASTAAANARAEAAEETLAAFRAETETLLREKAAELDAGMEALRTTRQQSAQWQAAYEAAQRSSSGSEG